MKCNSTCKNETNGINKICSSCIAKRIEYRKQMIANGFCYRCSKKPKNGYKHCSECLEKIKSKRKIQRKQRVKNNKCKECGKQNNKNGKCKICIEKRKQKNIMNLKYNKYKALEAYGGKCVCCKEDNIQFLTIDHGNNDGKQHRIEIKTSKIYRWIVKNNFPQNIGLRVMCWNCNLGRDKNKGICPHLEDKP